MKHLKYYPIFEASKQNWGEKYSDLVLGFSEKVKEENYIDEIEIKDICNSVLDDFKNYGNPELSLYLKICKNWTNYPDRWYLPTSAKELIVNKVDWQGVYSLFIEASSSLKNLIEKNMNLYFHVFIHLPGTSSRTEQKKIFNIMKESFESREWSILEWNGDLVNYHNHCIEFDIIKPVTYELAKSWLEQNRHLLSKD